MWLKQSGQGVAASAPAVKTAAGNAASARALLEAYESLAVAELSELKKTTVLAVASSDEIAKALLTMVVNLVRNSDKSDLKAQLAAQLKEFKESGGGVSDADVRKEAAAKYGRAAEIEAFEETLERLGKSKDKLLAEAGDVAPSKSPREDNDIAARSPRIAESVAAKVSRSAADGDLSKSSGSLAELEPVKSPSMRRVAPVEELSKSAVLRSSGGAVASPAMGRTGNTGTPVLTRVAVMEEPKVEEAELSQSPNEAVPFIEMAKYAQSYNPDAKFERAQPGVPSSVSKASGVLPKIGRKEETKKTVGGSSCPVCSTRFLDQASLLAHIETCAASQVSSPIPSQREAAPQPGSKAKDLLKKVTDFVTQPQQPQQQQQQQPAANAPTSAVFIGAPTAVVHEGSMAAGGAAVKKMSAPKTPAPKAPGAKKPAVPEARSRSRTGGSNDAQTMSRPEVPRAPARPATPAKSRPRAASVDSQIESEPREEMEQHLEIIFYTGDIALDALNGALGSRTAADAELIVACKVGSRWRRQLEPLPVSTVLGLRKDVAHFSCFDEVVEKSTQLQVGVFMSFKNGAARELLGKFEIALPSLLKLDEKVTLPVTSSQEVDIGRIAVSARLRTVASPRTAILAACVSYKLPPAVQIPLAAAMSAARYACTIGLTLPVEGSLMQTGGESDPLLAAADAWPVRYAELSGLIKSKHPLPAVGWQNQQGQTLLHLVAIYGDVEALDVLLNAVYRKNDREVFANVFDRNKKDKRDLSPLHYACIHENLECITALLGAGARIDSAYKQIQPIHLAAVLGKASVVRVLLDRGAECDAPDYNTTASPLFYAAYAGSIPCIDLLMAKGAFIDAEDRSGLTALLIGGVCGNVPVITYLMQRSVKPVMASLDGSVSLPWTVLTADHPELRALLSRFAKDKLAQECPPYKRTLLHRAVLTLDDEALMEAVASLIERLDGRVLDAQDVFGRTVVHYAAALGKRMALQRLLEAGADGSVKDKAGNTPLHLCCLSDCAELLLAANCSPNEVNTKRMTALHTASFLGLLELRSCLCGWGARVERGMKPAVINLVPPKTCKVQIKIADDDPYDDGLVLE